MSSNNAAKDILDTKDIFKNLCIVCGEDMGDTNPRQYCGKTFCYNEEYIKMLEEMKEEDKEDKEDKED